MIKLRYKEAAAYLGVSVRSLRRFVSAGDLGCEIIGHSIRYIYVSELDDFLARHTKPATRL